MLALNIAWSSDVVLRLQLRRANLQFAEAQRQSDAERRAMQAASEQAADLERQRDNELAAALRRLQGERDACVERETEARSQLSEVNIDSMLFHFN